MSNLFDIADDRVDLEPFTLGVDGVQAPHQVLQEQLEGLQRQSCVIFLFLVSDFLCNSNPNKSFLHLCWNLI